MIDESKRCSRDELIAALGAERVRGNSCACPFHDDAHNSGSIYQGPDGVWRFKCQAGQCGVAGDVFDILARHRGVPVAEILRGASVNGTHHNPGPKPPPPPAEPRETFTTREAAIGQGAVATWDYTDSGGRWLLTVARFNKPDGGKWFRPVSQQPDGAFVRASIPSPRPLYNLPALAGAESVVVCEGEKAAQTLIDHGVMATTSLNGAENASLADWSPLAGKSVYIWPDHDEAGEKYASTVAKLLEPIEPPPTVYVLDPSEMGLPPKGDAYEFALIYAEDTGKALATFQESANRLGAGSELEAHTRAVVAGKIRCVHLPDWPTLSHLSRALLPGTISVVVASPGASKSFFLLQLMGGLHDAGEKTATWMLEDDRAFHLRRAVAQRSGVASYTDEDWIAAHPADATAIDRQYRPWVDSFGRTLRADAIETANYKAILAWIEARAKAGCRVVAVDPITMASSLNSKVYEEDPKFLGEVKRLAVVHGLSVLFVTHPRGSARWDETADDIAGARSWSRFVHCVIGMTAQDPEDVKIQTPCGVIEESVNRVVKVAKARSGRGTGARIGYWFDPSTLRWIEHGPIQPKKKGK